jgi:hypothetical protein
MHLLMPYSHEIGRLSTPAGYSAGEAAERSLPADGGETAPGGLVPSQIALTSCFALK